MTAPVLIASVRPLAVNERFWCFASAGNGDRFVRLFANLWNAIPADDRAAILAACPHPDFGPHIELRREWPEWRPGLAAAVHPDDSGTKVAFIRFYAPVIDTLDDLDTQFVIGHEMAHVRFLATEPITPSKDPTCAIFDSPDLERRVNALAALWVGSHREHAVCAALRTYFLGTPADATDTQTP